MSSYAGKCDAPCAGPVKQPAPNWPIEPHERSKGTEPRWQNADQSASLAVRNNVDKCSHGSGELASLFPLVMNPRHKGRNKPESGDKDVCLMDSLPPPAGASPVGCQNAQLTSKGEALARSEGMA